MSTPECIKSGTIPSNPTTMAAHLFVVNQCSICATCRPTWRQSACCKIALCA
jgi:hypothetical protein